MNVITQLPGVRLAMLSRGTMFVQTTVGIGMLVPAASGIGNVFVAPRAADQAPANDNGDRFGGAAR